MDKALGELQDCAVAYILVFSSSWEKHLVQLQRMLMSLLQAKRKKSRLGCTSIQYFRFHKGQGKIWAIPDKAAALAQAQPNPQPGRCCRGSLAWPATTAGSCPALPPWKFPDRYVEGQGEGNQTTRILGALMAFAHLKAALCCYPVLHAPLPITPLWCTLTAPW